MKRLLIIVMFLLYGCANTNRLAVVNMGRELKVLSKTFNPEECMRYNLDAACSICLAEALVFIDAYEKAKISIPCYLYVDNSYKEVFLYYLESHSQGDEMKILFIDDEYPYGIEEQGVAFVIDKDGMILRKLPLCFNGSHRL